MAISNEVNATLESTGGVLTIDGSNTTFSNKGLLEANGGELDLASDTLTNTGTLKATQDRKSVVKGKSVDLGGRRIIKEKGSALERDVGDSNTGRALGNRG